MSSTAKVGLFALVATAIAAVAYYGSRKVIDLGDKISVAFQSIGKPTLKLGVLTVPVNVLLTNNTPLSATLDNLRLQLVKPDGTVFGDTGNSGALPISVGPNVLTVTPSITLANIIGANFWSNAGNVLSNQAPVLQAAVRVMVTYLGVTITKDYPQTFYLTDLVNARG